MFIRFSYYILIFFISFNVNAEFFRLGYIQYGNYVSYKETINNINSHLPQNISFAQDNFYEYNWDDPIEKKRNSFEEMLSNKYIDLIIVFGTKASNDILDLLTLSNIPITKHIIFGSITNPKESKIFEKINNLNSREKNSLLHVYYTPDRYSKIIQMLTYSIYFKNLGMIIHDNSISGITDIETNLLTNNKKNYYFYIVDSQNTSFEECKNGIDFLIKKGIDSFLMTPITCLDYYYYPEETKKLIKILNEKNIMVFSRNEKDIDNGISFLSLSDVDSYNERGKFYANKIVEILLKNNIHEVVYEHNTVLYYIFSLEKLKKFKDYVNGNILNLLNVKIKK